MITTLLWAIHLQLAAALNGNGRQAFTTYDGWKAFEVVTQGDKLGGFELPGNLDGIGAYLMEGGDDIRVLVNHESPYDCDLKNDASVSELIISKSSFISAIKNILTADTPNNIEFVTSMDLAYDSFRLKDGSIANVKDFGVFKWFCSGTVHKAHTFGCNSGFVDEMYIFGEEAPADWGHGRFFALHDKTLHLISGSGSGNAVELQGGINGLPEDALENVAMVDTGETGHVVLVCSPDYGTKTLKLYVGRKGVRTNGESCGECTDDEDFLSRNGLAFGSTFYMQGSLPTKGGSFEFGSFGTNINAAIKADKLEDVATSPLEPTKVVLAEQLTGVYMIDLDIKFVDGVFSATSSVTKLDIKISNPDNVEVALDGSIYAVSDDTTGSVMRMTPDGKVATIAAGDGEATGIVDISHVLGLDPSSILLVNTMSCPASMSVLVNPNTEFKTPNPTNQPTTTPTNTPSSTPSEQTSQLPSFSPSLQHITTNPTIQPSAAPTTIPPTKSPSRIPSLSPSLNPTNTPSAKPSFEHSQNPSTEPSVSLDVTSLPSISSVSETPAPTLSILTTLLPTRSTTNQPSITAESNIKPINELLNEIPTDSQQITPTNNPSDISSSSGLRNNPSFGKASIATALILMLCR